MYGRRRNVTGSEWNRNRKRWHRIKALRYSTTSNNTQQQQQQQQNETNEERERDRNYEIKNE